MPISLGSGSGAAAYDIGDQVELTIYVTNDAGTASTATVTCTITLPDGTTSAPSVTTSATGTYSIEYASAVAGTFYVRWVADAIGGSATEDDVFEDSFTVSESANAYISLAEGKTFLNMRDTDDDDELLAYLEWACDLAQQIADTQFARKTIVDTLSSDGTSSMLVLTKRPVISVTTVTERGTTVASTGYSCDLRWGHLHRLAATYDLTTWSGGYRSNVVTYVAGYAIIPTPVRNATLQILEHLWSNQRNRGGSGRPTREDSPQVGANWNVPNKARDVLLDYRPPQVR
jgi:uncharacterized repeat protein (TIGR01451 family)